MRPLHRGTRCATAGITAAMLALAVLLGTSSCGGTPQAPTTSVSREGLNVVRIEPDSDREQNSHPASVSPEHVATILRGVRAWEYRNIIHRLISGEPPRTRAFRDEEIAFLAPSLSRALAQAGPTDRVYFHLSHVAPTGEEETTTGWLRIREPLLHLILSEVHDRHGPGPDISKYDRQMPDIPEASGPFKVTFEPERYVANIVSGWSWFRIDQHEELHIHYRDALSTLPPHPLNERPPVLSPSPENGTPRF